jgi:HEAT repeat protein
VSSFSLTPTERTRIDHIDRLVVLGAAGVPELIETMSDPSWTVRRASVAALAAAGDDAVPALTSWLVTQRTSEHAIAAAVDALVGSIGATTVPATVALLDHANPAVVTDAAQILGRRRANAAAANLERLLAHADDNVALAAIDALGMIGAASSVEPLIRVLASDNFFRTFAALQILPKLGDPRVIAPLAKLLEHDTYRIEAINALGRTGMAQAIPPLAGVLTTLPGETLIRPLARAFSDLVARAEWSGGVEPVVAELRAGVGPSLDRFVAALRGADASERAAIATVLGRIGDAAMLPALARLLDDEALRQTATDAIQRISKGADAALIVALNASEASRMAVLPVVSTPRATTTVIPLLSDDNPDVRARACEALARIGDTAAVAGLFDLLGDPSPLVAHAAAAAIQSLGSAETTPRTLAALATGTPAVRRQALRILATLGSRGTFEALRAAADEPDPRIAELAIAALASVEDPRASSALAELSRSNVDSVRGAVMRAVAHRADVDASVVLQNGLADSAPWVRYYACQGLGRLGDLASAPLLIALLDDAVPHVRIAAIEALAHLDTDEAWNALADAAGSQEPDERRAALIGIGLHARPAALGFLLAAAASPDEATRLIALAGLGRRSEPAALAALDTAARSSHKEIADAALSLLSDRTDAAAAEVIVGLAVDLPPEHPAHSALSQPARVDAIVARLGHSDDRTTATLIAALARMRAEPALVAALELPDPMVRRHAVTALFAIDAPGARRRVAELAVSDPDLDVRRACAAVVAGG